MNQHRPSPSIQSFLADTSSNARVRFFAEMASLAPSPYNTQPWHFSFFESALKITPNHERRLRQADPELRGLYFSLGAALENVLLAASALGVFCEPSICLGESEPYLEIRFKGLEAEPTEVDFATLVAITDRHTNRFAFLPQALPARLIQYIKDQERGPICSRITDDESKVALLQQYTQQAVKQIFTDKSFTKELSIWLKSSRSKHEAGMPGYVLGIPKWFSFVLPRLIRYGSAHVVTKAQQKVHARWFDSAQIFGYLGVDTITPESLLASGQAFERIAVEAQKYGIVLGPMSALVEAKGFAARVGDVFNTTSVPAMLYRIGYATKTPPASPRLKMHKTSQ